MVRNEAREMQGQMTGALEVTVRTFTLSEIGNHWRILSRGEIPECYY